MENREIIHNRMLVNIDSSYDKSEGSFFYDATKPAAIEFERKNEEIKKIEEKIDIENLQGEELERFIYQRTGITRKHATKALTTVIISGQEGSSIKKGNLVRNDTVNYIILENITIDQSGKVAVFASCEKTGTIGNTPVNTINKFPVTIPGLINVYNPESVTNGYEAESDDDLRQRYYDKLQRPGKSGNKYHYLEWAKEVVGVGNARVFPRWNGPLTVKVAIVDSNKQPASTELVERVFDHIEGERPFGADVTVISAIAKVIDISVTLIIAEGYTVEYVKENIKNNVTAYLKEIAFKTTYINNKEIYETYISYAKIGSIIFDTEGVIDHQNLLVNGGISNITIGSEEVAIMGVI